MHENNKGIADKTSSIESVPKYAVLTKAEEDALIMRAVRGEAQAMAEMHARYRGLIVSEAHASYLRNAALAADAENIAVLLGTSASAVSKSKANLLRKLRAGAEVECAWC